MKTPRPPPTIRTLQYPQILISLHVLTEPKLIEPNCKHTASAFTLPFSTFTRVFEIHSVPVLPPNPFAYPVCDCLHPCYSHYLKPCHYDLPCYTIPISILGF